jgi:hypothetical protein
MVVICGAGCVSSKPPPDPLTGWVYCYSNDPVHSNKGILDDYNTYIKQLRSREKKFSAVALVNMFKDATGEHAVKIEIPVDGVWREHVLIYDKDNKRIKVIKYYNGRYQS